MVVHLLEVVLLVLLGHVTLPAYSGQYVNTGEKGHMYGGWEGVIHCTLPF